MNGSPSKTTAADDVGIGIGVSVGVVILVASVLVVVVIASRKSKYTNMFHHLFNMPFWLLSYTTPGLYIYLLVLLKVIADAVLLENSDCWLLDELSINVHNVLQNGALT